ncbi:MAG: hypothetical protein HY820_08580 [Acidobacteria bacterium]|nr:hypothetical protein [Acidobacteriota bacterium]
MIDANGSVRTLLGSLSQPLGLAWDPGGNLVYAEAGAHRVTLYNLATRRRTVIAGTGTAGFSGDGGAATSATINTPGDVLYDSKGNLWIADWANRRVRSVGLDGVIRTMIGSARGFSYDDISGQPANDVGLGEINGLAIDGADNIYVAEAVRISVVTEGVAHVLVGFLSQSDDGANTYRHGPLTGSDGLAVDSSGRVYYSAPPEGRVMAALPAR